MSHSRNIAIGDISSYLFIDRFFELLNEQMPRSLPAALERLEKSNLVAVNGNQVDITNLGAILFARQLSLFPDISQKTIRVIVYRGKNRIHATNEQPGYYGYAVKFEGLIKWIADQLPTNEIIAEATRLEVKMFPSIAIRELVANAMIHQDFYESGTEVMIEIFSDRLEITNPGRPLIDTLRFIDDPPVSRNELLADFMRRAGFCERRGSGIDRVIAYAEAFQLPAPDFIATANHTKVILYAHKAFRDMKPKDRIRATYQHACLRYVSNEEMTNQSLRERFNITKSNYPMVSRVIKESIEEGLIKPSDPDNRSKRFASYIPYWA